MKLIDTHAHLYANEFAIDIEDIIKRAMEAGVDKILLPNIDIESIEGLCNLVSKNSKMFYPMMGLHPCSVEEDYNQVLSSIREGFSSTSCIAVGEIGIDLYWDNTTLDIQREAFMIQCRWALDMNLPVAIHSREATDHIIEVLKLKEFENLTGVLHCFTGTQLQAKELLDLGFYLGVGGVVTFKNTTLREVLLSVPLDRVVLETDAPYLAPTPYRGKRNEPSYLRYVAETLAAVYGRSLLDIAHTTSTNALNLFKL